MLNTTFVPVGVRHVLVRHAGRGPALVLLHQSPQNSRALLPWIERLSARYAVFAPDTPGFGASDPLPLAEPSIPDYAAALAALFDALGIERALLYGVHTGAVTALRFALDHPARVAGLVCDGYARFNATEREALLADYLPPFEPVWDGGHLTWLFARLREQHFYFPWHDRRCEARLAYPVPSLARTHADVMDVLDAGDGYRVGYRAPFLYDDATAAARLTVPAHIYYRAEDVLAPHLERLPSLPEKVAAEIVQGGPAALVAKADAAFARHAARASVVDPADVCAAASAHADRRIVAGLAWRRIRGAGQGSLLVMGDFAQPVTVPATRDRFAQVLCVDLPGHGMSRDANIRTGNALLDALVAGLDVWQVADVAVAATGLSAALASLLAARLGPRCTGLTLTNPAWLNAEERQRFIEGLPDPTLRAGGGHLVAAWQWARTRHLFWPWLAPDALAGRRVAAPAPRRVHAEAVEIVRAGSALKAVAEMMLPQSPPPLGATPLTLTCADEPEARRQCERIAAAHGGLREVPAVDGPGWQSENREAH